MYVLSISCLSMYYFPSKNTFDYFVYLHSYSLLFLVLFYIWLTVFSPVFYMFLGLYFCNYFIFSFLSSARSCFISFCCLIILGSYISVNVPFNFQKNCTNKLDCIFNVFWQLLLLFFSFLTLHFYYSCPLLFLYYLV